MRIATEDIKPVPAEIHFVEEEQGLNQLLGQDGDADYRVTSPLRIELTHARAGDELLFSGVIHGDVIGQCGRCLEDYRLALTREFSLVLTPQLPVGKETELNYEELSASFYSGEFIDASALVHEQFLLVLPMPPLCQEDCKGLCSQCGVNRNLEICDCRLAWTDPRLAVLSSLRVSPPESGK